MTAAAHSVGERILVIPRVERTSSLSSSLPSVCNNSSSLLPQNLAKSSGLSATIANVLIFPRGSTVSMENFPSNGGIIIPSLASI